MAHVTPSRDDVEVLGSYLLAEHGDYHVNDDGWTVCICGHIAEGDDDDGSYGRHVASVILSSDWLAQRDREQQAKAWAEGVRHAEACEGGLACDPRTANPYRIEKIGRGEQ